jgi:hypothetical protein
MNGELIFSIVFISLLFSPSCGALKVVVEKSGPLGNKTSYYLEEK